MLVASVSAGTVINPTINMLHINVMGFLMTSTDINLKHIIGVIKQCRLWVIQFSGAQD